MWFVSSLEKMGGGERFAIESVAALREQGHEAFLSCESFDEAADFHGMYDLSDVVRISGSHSSTDAYLKRVISKASGLLEIARVMKSSSPDMVVCQSEFDAIRLYLVTRMIRVPYRVFVFGQMYQFKIDISKYAWIFRSHLQTIIESRPGYLDTVVMPPPKLPLFTRIANETISMLKYRAIRKANHVFTLSPQVQWEVDVLYKRRASVCRAAFSYSFIDTENVSNPKEVSAPITLLSVSRLVDKKRVDLIIGAFSKSNSKGNLRIIGVGPEEGRLRSLALQSPRSKDIDFLGAVEDSTLIKEIKNADCFISMDVGDFDLSVIEALGKGLRSIVATDFDLTGFEGSLDGIRTVEPNSEALSLAIDELEKMPGPSAANLEVLKLLTWQNLASKVCDLELSRETVNQE